MPLDNATFGTAECESLCSRHALSEGCCIVGDGFGCYWKGGATAEYGPSMNSLAVTCTLRSKSKYFLILYVHLKALLNLGSYITILIHQLN